MIDKSETGAIILLPDKIQTLRDTNQLGPVLVPKYMRDSLSLLIFDPINDVNRELVSVDRWDPVHPDSHICIPKGLELSVIDPIDVPERLWHDCNVGVMGSPELNSCQGLNFAAHSHQWWVMEDCSHDPDAYRLLLADALEQLSWEQDDPQYVSDAAFLQNMHLLDSTTQMDYMGGGVKTFAVRVPWK